MIYTVFTNTNKSLRAMSNKLIYLIAIFTTVSTFAQQDAMVSQYMFSGLALNPAYAGSHQFSNATLLARKQWTGMPGAPSTQFLSYEGPLANKKVGIGAVLMNDRIGVTNTTQLNGSYAYHLPVNEKTKLSMGLSAGLSYYSAKLTDLKYWDTDVVFENDVRSTYMPNFGAGLYLYSDRYYIGISVPHLINYDPSTTLNLKIKDVQKLVRHYYFNAGIAIDLNDKLTLKPSFLMKFVPNAPIEFDLNTNLLIDKKVWIGVSYRTNDAVVGIVEFLATKQLRIGYAYDFTVSGLRTYSGSTHELMLAYDFGYEIIKMKSPRFF